ncbi:Tyrosine-protein phosphatase non-receptor type 9 [Oopsacas minuta]|uniref:Tyrosine-protein phosphatase non-receptor type 9 n=1 Tax=Oopsacas minuta TaxID=111878 RepID=A0AAV7JEW7_9METZ|nr:Tyrosine-protein phosphatase non-receptor type 9 [Oopsacas minuta]
MSSELLQTTESTRITNNDIRLMASSDIMSSKDVLSSGSVKLQDSLEMESRAAETEQLMRSSSLTVSSELDRTIGSELSKTSKLTSSSPDCNIKSSGTSNGSSGGGAQRETFVASAYDEISPVGEFSATASPSHTEATTTPQLSEREMECLTTLMRLLATKKQPTNVETATKFLMARKFDLVRAWGLYESHLQRRRRYRLDSLDPHEQPLRGELAKRKFMFLGTRDKFGRAIALFQARNHFPKQSNPLTVMQALSLHLDHALYNTTTQRNGIILIYNMSGSGVKNLDYDLAKELLDFLQEAYPARLHRTYVLNAPFWFRAAVHVFSRVLKKKVIERLQLVNLSELQTVLPAQSLPEQLGGSLKFSYEDRLELCIAHWLTHPFSAIPPSLPNQSIQQEVNLYKNLQLTLLRIVSVVIPRGKQTPSTLLIN